MGQLLAEVQDGSFAKRWIRENEEGQPRFRSQRQKARSHQIESVGRELRSRMTFLDPVEILPEKEPVSD